VSARKILQPLHEQRLTVRGLDSELVVHLLATLVQRDELAERSGGLGEDLLRGVGFDRQLDLGGVTAPFMHR